MLYTVPGLLTEEFIMLHQITAFVINHWMLASAFVIVMILLFLEEMKSKHARGAHLSVSAVTQCINRQEAIVIDLRDANAYREGHIVNAKNMPVAEFERHQEKLAAQGERPIILVDAMGLKTAPIVLRLKSAGFQNVVTLKGGMDAWRLAGMPVVKK